MVGAESFHKGARPYGNSPVASSAAGAWAVLPCGTLASAHQLMDGHKCEALCELRASGLSRPRDRLQG